MSERRNPNMITAGKRLKELRDEKKLTQEDITSMSRDKYGPEGVITTAQLSRIEGGSFQRVNLDDAVRIGCLLGMTPNQVAALYGLWDEETASTDAEEIAEARRLAATLPDDLRQQLLQWIQFAVLTTRDQMLHRLRDQATASGDRDMRLYHAEESEPSVPPAKRTRK